MSKSIPLPDPHGATSNDQLKRSLATETARADSFFATSRAMMLIVNLDGRVVQINDVACSVLGCTKGEAVGRDWITTFVPLHDQVDRRREHADLLAVTTPPSSSTAITETETNVVVRSGRVRRIAWRNTVMRDGEGRVVGVLASGQDVTESRLAEKQVRVLNRRYEMILEAAGDGILGQDLNGLALFVNPAAASMLGYQTDELIGLPIHDMIHHSHADGTDYDFEASPAMAPAHDGQVRHVTDEVFWRADGTFFPVEYTSTPTYEDGVITGSVVVFRDVTEQRALQAQLVQSSKLATLGEMATGVAHELNQPLNVISMAVQNIMRRLSKGSTPPDYITKKLNRIANQTKRAASIIDHMRIFGRPAGKNVEVVSVAQVIANARDFLSEQFRLSAIVLSVEAPNVDLCVSGHQVQLEQVLLNLLMNARDALKDRGSTETARIWVSVRQIGDAVALTVRDNAGGVPPAALERLFEPFFTTKEVGKGTGLGLSISYGIITDMGGTISVNNDADGACFTIILPIAQQEIDP